MRAEFQRRRNYIVQRISNIQDISCRSPEGAFYVFPNVSAFIGKEYQGTYIRNSYGLCYYLLREAKVATIPGAAFGLENYIRISYASSLDNIQQGMDRIEGALKKLTTPARDKIKKLNNTKTKVSDFIPADPAINLEKRDALVAEAENQLKYDSYFEWNANIGGVIVQLRTNSSHLHDFWVENWYPAQLEADIEPHGIIYAVDGIAGREPHAFYNPDSKTGIIFNSDFYGVLRRVAIAMVSELGGNLFGLHCLRGMTGDLNGSGFALLGPKGTHKSELFYRMLQLEKVALVSNDIVFIRYGGGYASADTPERKMYWPTNSSEIFGRLTPLFERSKCENVVTSREGCGYSDCTYRDDCMLDRGLPFCLYGSKKAHAMLDPYWIGGMKKHVKRTDLSHIFILACDTGGDILRPLEPADALQILKSGQTKGTSATYGSAGTPFFNPHLYLTGDHQVEKQAEYFGNLLQYTHTYLLNTEGASPVEIEKHVLDLFS
jgi:hypothetical protein